MVNYIHFFLLHGPTALEYLDLLYEIPHSHSDTLGRTAMDEWSNLRRPLPENTNTHKSRQTCPQLDSKPQSQQSSGSRPTP